MNGKKLFQANEKIKNKLISDTTLWKAVKTAIITICKYFFIFTFPKDNVFFSFYSKNCLFKEWVKYQY